MNEQNLRTVLERLPREQDRRAHVPSRDSKTRRARYGHWHYAWAAETAALTSPRIRELIGAHGVRLIGYRDV